MATGYSGTPQARKLGLKPGHRVALDQAPPGWTLTDPPPDLQLTTTNVGTTANAGGGEPADVIVGFFTAADQLAVRLPALVRRIHPAGALWIAWPRRAGGYTSDLTDNVVRAAALPLGVVDTKVAAIDDDWSALRLVWRLANRP